MIVLFTDFGLNGPYTGQMKAVLHREAPGVPVVDLFADAPSFNPRASAYLLAAYAVEFLPGSVFLCVVDPGVGSDQRRPVVVKVDGRWFVGPDNGLFHPLARHGQHRERWEIRWRPERLSASFHGRDLFAPVAAALARGETGLEMEAAPWREEEFEGWPEDLPEVIYLDRFGNAITGLRAASLTEETGIAVGDTVIHHARTFSDVDAGACFWYENSSGLVELAVNSGSAAKLFDLKVGDQIDVV